VSEKYSDAERALCQAAAIISLRRQGLARAKIAETLGMSGRRVWAVEYSLGLTDNADDKMRGTHPRTMRLVP